MTYSRKRAQVALRRLTELPVRSSSDIFPPYVRTEFSSGWQDLDGDGQNERAEILIATHRSGPGSVPIRYGSEEEHRVTTGRWRCRFSGTWVTDATELDIDHLVPLAEAWESGAYAWTDDLRSRYANGVGLRSWNRSWLLPVLSGLNRAKGAKRPDEWLPPNSRYHLHYVCDWVKTKRYWGLSVAEKERQMLLRILEAEVRQ